MSCGFTKNLVLPEPEPPMTSTFLFRAVLGSLGRLFIVSRSVWVRMMLFRKSGSIYGSMSSGVPQRAEPYSVFLRNFLAFLPRTYTTTHMMTAPAIPMSRSIGWKLGSGEAKALPKPSARCRSFWLASAPGARRMP